MNIKDEIVECYTKRKSTVNDVEAKYTAMLEGKDKKGLLKAAIRLLSAHCAAPGFSTSRQLDMLAENNPNMQILRVLIREYNKGVQEVLDVYSEYLSSDRKEDFWAFFNEKLELPNNWLDEAKNNIKKEDHL